MTTCCSCKLLTKAMANFIFCFYLGVFACVCKVSSGFYGCGSSEKYPIVKHFMDKNINLSNEEVLWQQQVRSPVELKKEIDHTAFQNKCKLVFF